MNHRSPGTEASIIRAGRPLLAALLLGALQLHAATPDTRVPAASKPRPVEVSNFAVLSQDRPRKCIDEKETEPAARGWREVATRCAWQNRLQMRRWEADQDSESQSCLSKPALWWGWERRRVAPATGPVAWHSAWSTQSLVSDYGTRKMVAIIERNANGSWMAVEWTWAPSPRAATRKWQEGRWKLLTDAAMQMRRSAGAPPDSSGLRTTWEKNLKGSVGEIAAANWLWQRDGLCMRMETAGISQAQLHLPYSREDGRLEQRAAMQLRLARTHPKAAWLTPFRLLPPPDSAPPGGAKFEAIWIENATVKGQLWIPTKADGPILRARIAVVLPAKKGAEAEHAAIEAAARAIDRELIGLATIWSADHEQ